jgi:ABC-type multidrug transport system permease subunit
MTTLKTLGVVGALLLGSSTLALAQTESFLGLPVTPPASGSHPEMVAPQNAPDSWVVGEDATSASPAAVPNPQTASTDLANRNLNSAIKRTIENAGYSSVYGITPSLDGYHARAMESGQRVTVDVDENGNVRRVTNQHG